MRKFVNKTIWAWSNLFEKFLVTNSVCLIDLEQISILFSLDLFWQFVSLRQFVYLGCQIYWHGLLTVFSCYPFIAVEFRAMAPLVFLMLINFLFLFSWLICVEVYQCYWSSQRTSVGSLFLLLFFCYLCWFMFPSLHFPSFDLLCVEFVLFLVLYVGCGAICLWPFLFFCDLNVWFSPESCFKGNFHREQ